MDLEVLHLLDINDILVPILCNKCGSVGSWDCIVNPNYGCGVKITQDVNPIYVG